jgi:hypothetical protein
VSDEEVQAAITAYNSQDMPDRDRVTDIKDAMMLLNGPLTVVQVIAALYRAGYEDVAANVLEMQRQRVAGDYLQPSAIFDRDFNVRSALTDPNDYLGPGTGYRVEGERWQQLQDIPQAWDPRGFLVQFGSARCEPWLEELGPACPGDRLEVVIALGPAFGVQITETIGGLGLRDVLAAMLQGIADESVPARVIKVHHTSDCAFIGHAGAKLSGSGVAIGIQSKGTTVIHQRDLPPLENLELFSMAPNMTLDTYRQLGRNAACYALQKPTMPVPVKIDNLARLRLIVQTTLMHLRETRQVEKDREPSEVQVRRAT